MHQIELIEEGFIDRIFKGQLIFVDVLFGFQKIAVRRDLSVLQDTERITDIFQFLQVMG